MGSLGCMLLHIDQHKVGRYTGMASTDDWEDDVIESFGCHLSWTELRPCAADKQTLSREEGILAREVWDFNDRPAYYTATQNVRGFIAYHLNKYEQALWFFRDVLQNDPNNINALGNIAFIHKRLYEMDEHKIYRKRLVCVLKEHSYAERAMAYADKAHSIRYFEQFKRCFRYMRFIKKAATIGRKCDGPQRAEWIFDYALALYRRDRQMLYLKKLARDADIGPENSECYSDARIWEGFLKACQHFLEVARISTSRDCQALSWVFLGILVNHDPEHRNMAMAFPDEPGLWHYTAEQCFEKGMEIHPEHAIVLRRVGSEYVKLGSRAIDSACVKLGRCHFAKARRLLDKSLRKSPSQFGYRHRALMFLAMYEKASEKERQTEQARQWLREAVEDFTKALEKKEFHADNSDLGYAYFLLGETNKALVKFEQATNNKQDDYFDPVLTHQRWAQCLNSIHEVEGSRLQKEEVRKVREKILETPLVEDEEDYFSDDLNYYSTNEKSGFVRILKDYHFWPAYSKRRTSELDPPDSSASSPDKTQYRYDFFVWHAERDSRWTVAFVHKLESEHGLSGSIQWRDFVVGEDIPSEILRCIKESYKFVIVFTPHVVCQEWSRTVLVRAEMEANRRVGNFILPIKLRDCVLPDLLKPFTPLECEEGQILKKHWNELVENLTK